MGQHPPRLTTDAAAFEAPLQQRQLPAGGSCGGLDMGTDALGTHLGEPPFAKSTLRLFRAMLVLHGGVQQIFVQSFDFAEGGGFRRGRKLKVAVDTTPVLGAAAVKDTCNLLADGTRRVIRELSVQAGLKPDEWAKENGLGRYLRGSVEGQSQVDWADEESRRRFLTGMVEDAEDLLERGVAKTRPTDLSSGLSKGLDLRVADGWSSAVEA